MSAVVKLIPRPPARVVNRKMNFSLSGLLYSSMATIRSSCAVLPSIRQYSLKEGKCELVKQTHLNILTVLSEETVIFQDIQHATHLTEDQHAGAFRLHVVKELV